MAKIIAQKKQNVDMYPEISTTQQATVYENDVLIVIHGSSEIVISIDNWKKLVTLVHSILPTEKGGY